MKHNKKIIASVVAGVSTVTMTGCMTANVKKADTETRKINDHVLEKFDQNTTVSKESFYVKESDGFYAAGDSYRLNEKSKLPRFFNDRIIISQPELMSLTDISNLVAKEFKVDTSFSEDALAYLLDLADSSESLGSSGSSSGGGASDAADFGMMAPDMGIVEATAPGGDLIDGSSLDLVPLMALPDIDGEEATINTSASIFKFKIEHTGSLKELLNSLSAKTGLFWKWNSDHIEFYRTDTKTFILNDLPGQIKFTASSGAAAKSSGAGGASSATQANSKHGIELTSSADSNWNSMKATIEAMLTDLGSVNFAEQTGTITVTDTPTVLDKASAYIEDMNEIISQRILLKVEIFDVNYNDQDDSGLDLEALYSGSSKLGFQFASGLLTDGQMEFGVIDPINNWAGSTALVRALKANYKTSLVNTSMSYTTNGIPVPVQILNAQSYLAQMTTETDSEGNESTEFEVEVLNKGINMSMLPKRMDNGDILLHLSADIMSLNNMRTVTTSSGSLELPDTDQKNFMQRIAVKPGETLLLAGFDRTTNEAKTDSIFGKDLWGIGGTQKGGVQRTKTLILVTPYTMSR